MSRLSLYLESDSCLFEIKLPKRYMKRIQRLVKRRHIDELYFLKQTNKQLCRSLGVICIEIQDLKDHQLDVLYQNRQKSRFATVSRAINDIRESVKYSLDMIDSKYINNHTEEEVNMSISRIYYDNLESLIEIKQELEEDLEINYDEIYEVDHIIKLLRIS